jgi:hypothetical protein
MLPSSRPRTFDYWWIVAGALGLIAPASAEVFDKIPSAPELWIWAIGIALASYALGRARPWLSLAIWPIGIGWGWFTLVELSAFDSSDLAELGSAYVATSYLAPIVAIIAPLAIAALLAWRTKAKR